ncbi:unnamed protein product [Blepharisma stoltei]|uniref:Cyclin N-terminal domain-containing protein n=1 Tax=Blepharisma stoltei TaxID=1481888 RepID=A0AAU9KEW3_9CILI|nr:unnamed protein product [Blepharisma stoltei]
MSLTDTSKENLQLDPKNTKVFSSRNALKSLNISSLLNTSPSSKEANPTNPQLLIDYAPEIFKNLHEQEPTGQVSQEYMKLQPEINQKLRAVLIDWIVSAHKRFKLLPETLFLSVTIIDKYLEKRAVTRQQLQLVGVTSLYLSSKYEEIYPPELKDFVQITDRAYTREQVVKMEKEILNTLNFNITLPTSWRFFERYGGISDLNSQGKSVGQYLLELALVEYHMLKYKPSLKAVAATYMGHKILNRDYSWRIEDTGYSDEEIKCCAKDMLILFQAAPRHPLTAVKEKFSRPQFHEVSSLRIS